MDRQVENVKQLHERKRHTHTERERERERERESGAIGRRTGLVDRGEGRLNGSKRHRSINHLVDQPRRPCFRPSCKVMKVEVEVEVEVEVVAQLLVRLAAVVKPLRRWVASPSTMASQSTAASPSRAAPRRSGGAQGAAARLSKELPRRHALHAPPPPKTPVNQAEARARARAGAGAMAGTSPLGGSQAPCRRRRRYCPC